MKLLVGLGNPGLWYVNTRHNVGFTVIKELSRRCRIPIRKKMCRGLLGEGSVKGEKVILFMPQTYMNLSGEAVYEVIRAKEAPIGDMLVICDDISLKVGSLRLREKGSSGGHKGMNSIIQRLGTEMFPRLRLGIGSDIQAPDLTRFVLERFSGKERPLVDKAVREACDCAVMWVEEGAGKAMSVFNKKEAR